MFSVYVVIKPVVAPSGVVVLDTPPTPLGLVFKNAIKAVPTPAGLIYA